MPASIPPPAPPAERRFRYLRDPVFLTAVALYLLNRFAIKPYTGNTNDFFHCWLNDLVCIPFWLPLILRLRRALGLREHDAPPTVNELVALCALWSLVFEFVVPATALRTLFPNAVGDPVDVFMYVSGALLAGLLWRSGEAPPATPSIATSSSLSQHLAIALGITGATTVGTMCAWMQDPWRMEDRAWHLYEQLQRIAVRVTEARDRTGQLPAEFEAENLRNVANCGPVLYRVEGEQFVLVHLGRDGALGGVGESTDVWWPAERQPPPEPWAWLWSRDLRVAAGTGVFVGGFLAIVWLGWRATRTPRFPRLSGRAGRRAAADLLVGITITTVLLFLQNDLVKSMAQSGH
jgi:hypothetical protein